VVRHAVAPAHHLLGGDLVTFESEILPYRADLLARAYRLTRSRADAEDLVQDTLIRALRSWSSYRSEGQPRGWLYRILWNRFVSVYRTQRATGTMRARLLVETDVEWRDPDAGLSAEILSAIGELPAAHREVLLAVDVHGDSYVEASGRLDIPVNTVRTRLHRARKTLRRALEGSR
jgi:RNA polymerase sigma-70 factor (ECF subfamily)